MIKVLHVSSAMSWRGGEQQLTYMLKGMIPFNMTNFVLVPINSEFILNNNIDNIDIFTQKKSHGVSLKWALKIKEICEKEKIDIVHCHDSKAHTYAVLANVIYKNKTPIIAHRKVLFKIKNSFLTRFKYKKVNHIVCVSRAVEKVVLNTFKELDTSVIYSAVSLEENNSDISLRKRYSIPKTHKLIGIIGALTFEKDHETFLRVAKKMLDSNENLTFVIIGTGKLESQLKELTKKMNIEKNIIFTGFIPDAKLLTKQLDLFMFTSLSEGLGTVILDAFVQKTPVVTVKNGGSQEIVKNDITGYICDKKDVNCLSEKANFILNSEIIQKRITNQAKLYVKKNHSISKMVDDLFELYKKVNNECN